MTDKKTNNQSSADQSQSAASTKAETTASTKPQSDKAATAKNTDKADQTAKAAPAQPAEKKSGNKTGVIAIALVIALGAGLYYHGHQQTLEQNGKMAALQQEISRLQSSLQETQQATKSQVSAIEQRTEVSLDQQGKSITGLQMALAEIKGRRPNDWLLAEADYLVKMAGRKLWLEHDTVSATVLLESADHRIAELNDPSLTPIRKAMHSDITALKAVARIDRDGLVMRLTSLQQQVAALPLANAVLPESIEAEEKTEVSGSVDDWKQNLMTSLKNFSNHFVTYRKRDGNVVPLLSPKQDFYLQENVKSKLETAIKAVYREQGELYTASLTMAKEWAEAYYNTEDPAVQSFIATLDKLAKETVEASYPSQLKSQPLLNDAISERLRQQVKPISTEETPA